VAVEARPEVLRANHDFLGLEEFRLGLGGPGERDQRPAQSIVVEADGRGLPVHGAGRKHPRTRRACRPGENAYHEMIQAGRTMRGAHRFIAVALLSLGALSAAGVAYRASLGDSWMRLRIRWKPAYVLEILEREPGSAGGKAARWFAGTPEGKKFLLGVYLEQQFGRGSQSVANYVSNLDRDRWLVIRLDPERGAMHYLCSIGGRTRRVTTVSVKNGNRSVRTIETLLGEAGAEGLISPDFPGVSFSFVRPDRRLVALPQPRLGLLIVPTGETTEVFGVVRPSELPSFVCLVLNTENDYPYLFPASFDARK